MEGGWYRSWKTVRSANTGACHHPISRIGPGPSPWAVCPSLDPQYSELRHVDSTFGTLQPRDEGGVGYKGALIVFHHSGLPSRTQGGLCVFVLSCCLSPFSLTRFGFQDGIALLEHDPRRVHLQ